MKKSSTSLFAIALIVLASVSSITYASSTKSLNEFTVKSNAESEPIKQIYITGNVEVLLVQDFESNQTYIKEGKAKIRLENNTLYIKGKDNKIKSKVTVYIGKEINRISLADESSLTTKNLINTKYLQIIMQDHAAADINSRTESLYTKLSNEATLKLNGITRNHAISTNNLAQLNTDHFKALSTEIEKRNDFNFANKVD